MSIEKNGQQVGRPTKEQQRLEDEKLREDWDNGGARALHLRDIDDVYGESAVYERVRVENEARFYMGQSAQAMFELGRRLILLKEHEPHGEFLKSLERVGIEDRTAQNVLRATIKLANRKSIAYLEPTKMYALAMLDDEQLDELEQGGSVSDMTLDAIDKMTTRELRAELRRVKTRRREDTETYEQLLANKNKTIDEATARMHMVVRPDGWCELATELNKCVMDAWNTAIEGIERLWAVYSRLINEGRGDHKENLERSLPFVILNFQWHSQVLMESAERLVDMIRERLPMPWHPVNMTGAEITPSTKVEHLIENLTPHSSAYPKKLVEHEE